MSGIWIELWSARDGAGMSRGGGKAKPPVSNAVAHAAAGPFGPAHPRCRCRGLARVSVS